MELKCTERTKNMVLASLCMCLCIMAASPASSVQNIALADSTNIDLVVGYYSEIVKYSACILAGFIFHPFYKLAGIKITAAVLTILLTGTYWSMIWIVNEYTIYLGSFLSGLGAGSLWIIWPMVVVENSEAGMSQRNMGYWWMAESLGVVVGGFCNYFYFQNVSKISTANRVMVNGLAAGVTIISAIIAALGVSDITKSHNRHIPLTDKEITYYEIDQEGEAEQHETDKVEIIGGKDSSSLGQADQEDGISARGWFREMRKLKEFWILFLPLIYWGFIWGYFMKMLPTATASISDRRDLIPLSVLVTGSAYVVGSSSWNFISRCSNNTVCIILASLMHVVAITLSILVFPKSAASEISEFGTAETYIQPADMYVVVISGLIGLADSGISIIYYTTAGRIYGEGASLGFSVNNNGFCVFYIISMFTPSLFDLHSYCYCMLGAVLLMCLSLTVGLRKFIK